MASEVSALFFRARRALRVTQVDLAQMLGASRRTGQRWDAGQSYPSVSQLTELAKAVYARDPALASEVAVSVGTTVDALGLAAPAAPPAVPAPIESIVDSVVCAAAEAMDALPRAVRPALMAAFARARELHLSIEDVERGLKRKPPPKRAKGAPTP
jgi:transcriptional regulator with XRE-family HTH domain